MPYTLTNWQDSPSNLTPLNSANLLLYNVAINDIDGRINTKQAVLTVATVQTSNYTAVANQVVPVSTATSSVTVGFPVAPADGTRVGVKQVVRGGSNVVTLQLGGADTFNTVSGGQSLVLSGLGQGAMFQYVASTAVWLSLSNDIPLSQTVGQAMAMSMVLGSFVP